MRLGLLERRRRRGRRRRARARAARRARARRCRGRRRRRATTTSDGPPGRSIGTSRETSSFASFTYGVARARRSCRRARRRRASRSPAARRAPRPRRCRAASAAAATRPAPAGGVQTTIRSHARGLRRHGAHDERRDEVARDVDPDRVERHPAALEHDARLDLERRRRRGRCASCQRRTRSASVEHRLARQLVASAHGARGLGAVQLERPPAHRRRARAPSTSRDDRSRDHPLHRHDQDRRRARRLELRAAAARRPRPARARAPRPCPPRRAAARSARASRRSRRSRRAPPRGAFSIR